MLKIYDGRSSFYQWDLNQKLIVEDDTVNEVHFCNKTEECALICEVYELDSLRVVDVPNILLQNSWDIRAYSFTGENTKQEQRFKVIERSKPADYIYTPTEVKSYEQYIETINRIIENSTLKRKAVYGKLVAINDINPFNPQIEVKPENDILWRHLSIVHLNNFVWLQKENSGDSYCTYTYDAIERAYTINSVRDISIEMFTDYEPLINTIIEYDGDYWLEFEEDFEDVDLRLLVLFCDGEEREWHKGELINGAELGELLEEHEGFDGMTLAIETNGRGLTNETLKPRLRVDWAVEVDDFYIEQSGKNIFRADELYSVGGSNGAKNLTAHTLNMFSFSPTKINTRTVVSCNIWLDNGTYCLSGDSEGVSVYGWQLKKNGSISYLVDNSTAKSINGSFTIKEPDYYDLRFCLESPSLSTVGVFGNVQLEKAEEPTEFEPTIEEGYVFNHYFGESAKYMPHTTLISTYDDNIAIRVEYNQKA